MLSKRSASYVRFASGYPGGWVLLKPLPSQALGGTPLTLELEASGHLFPSYYVLMSAPSTWPATTWTGLWLSALVLGTQAIYWCPPPLTRL